LREGERRSRSPSLITLTPHTTTRYHHRSRDILRKCDRTTGETKVSSWTHRGMRALTERGRPERSRRTPHLYVQDASPFPKASRLQRLSGSLGEWVAFGDGGIRCSIIKNKRPSWNTNRVMRVLRERGHPERSPSQGSGCYRRTPPSLRSSSPSPGLRSESTPPQSGEGVGDNTAHQ